MPDPFKLTEELTSISSGIKASSQRESDLLKAYTKREAKIKNYKQEIFTNYFDSLPTTNPKTFFHRNFNGRKKT